MTFDLANTQSSSSGEVLPTADSVKDFKGAVLTEAYEITGEWVDTRWGAWIITDVVYADPNAKQIPIKVDKDIRVNPGESLSAQAHFGRGEVYKGVSGTTMVCVEGEVFELKAGDEVKIPRGALHFSWVADTETEPAVFHEVQQGPHCAEKDIKRGADRRKLNLPHILNSSTEDAGRSPLDVLLELRMKVAKDRYDDEVRQNGATVADYDRKVDFMPTVIELMDDYPQGFSDPNYKAALEKQFRQDIQAHLDLHEACTPALKSEVEQKLRAELKVA